MPGVGMVQFVRFAVESLLQLSAGSFGRRDGGANAVRVLCGIGVCGFAVGGLMPAVLLGRMLLDWKQQGLPTVNDVLVQCTSEKFGFPPKAASKSRNRCR
jgi:hypothetical protein